MATRETFHWDQKVATGSGGGSKPARKNNAQYQSSLKLFGGRAGYNDPLPRSGYADAFVDRSAEAAALQQPAQASKAAHAQTHFNNMYASSIHFATSWKHAPEPGRPAQVANATGASGADALSTVTRDAQNRTAALAPNELVELSATHARDAQRNREQSTGSILKLGREDLELTSSNAHSKHFREISREPRRYANDPSHAFVRYMRSHVTGTDPSALPAAGAAGSGGLEDLKDASSSAPAAATVAPGESEFEYDLDGRVKRRREGAPPARFKSNVPFALRAKLPRDADAEPDTTEYRAHINASPLPGNKADAKAAGHDPARSTPAPDAYAPAHPKHRPNDAFAVPAKQKRSTHEFYDSENILLGKTYDAQFTTSSPYSSHFDHPDTAAPVTQPPPKPFKPLQSTLALGTNQSGVSLSGMRTSIPANAAVVVTSAGAAAASRDASAAGVASHQLSIAGGASAKAIGQSLRQSNPVMWHYAKEREAQAHTAAAEPHQADTSMEESVGGRESPAKAAGAPAPSTDARSFGSAAWASTTRAELQRFDAAHYRAPTVNGERKSAQNYVSHVQFAVPGQRFEDVRAQAERLTQDTHLEAARKARRRLAQSQSAASVLAGTTAGDIGKGAAEHMRAQRRRTAELGVGRALDDSVPTAPEQMRFAAGVLSIEAKETADRLAAERGHALATAHVGGAAEVLATLQANNRTKRNPDVRNYKSNTRLGLRPQPMVSTQRQDFTQKERIAQEQATTNTQALQKSHWHVAFRDQHWAGGADDFAVQTANAAHAEAAPNPTGAHLASPEREQRDRSPSPVVDAVAAAAAAAAQAKARAHKDMYRSTTSLALQTTVDTRAALVRHGGEAALREAGAGVSHKSDGHKKKTEFWTRTNYAMGMDVPRSAFGQNVSTYQSLQADRLASDGSVVLAPVVRPNLDPVLYKSSVSLVGPSERPAADRPPKPFAAQRAADRAAAAAAAAQRPTTF